MGIKIFKTAGKGYFKKQLKITAYILLH